MSNDPNYALLCGYYEGTIKGNVSNIKCFRENGIMTDKEIVDYMLERFEKAIDNGSKGIYFNA